MENELYKRYFQKSFTFNSSSKYTLPDEGFVSPKWFIPELQSKKKELNEVKGLLSKYKLKVWSKHTANRDPAGFVMKKLIETVQPELLTQAWCKFFEILGHFPIISEVTTKGQKLNSLHLCEAPGAFVCSLNHYLVSKFDHVQWKWMATTLNPHHEGNELSQMIPDDRFLKFTLQNWNFGPDFLGDICSMSSHEHLVHHEFCKQEVMLITADGSIDCMKDPGEQERHVEHIHFCETFTAIRILRQGGCLVLKIFTMFEESTICLLYLLTCLFEKVTVFKPCTSKSGNSEVYVINLGFKGVDMSSKLMQDFLSSYTYKDRYVSTSMFRIEEVPSEFLDDIHECSTFYMKKQITTILDNIYHFENRIYDNIFELKSQVADLYFKLYQPKMIPKYRRLVQNVNVGECWRIYNTFKIKGFYKVPVDFSDISSSLLEIKTGKPIHTVKSSKFTHKDNLDKIKMLYTKNESHQLYDCVLKVISERHSVLNVNMFDLDVFYKFQRNIFKNIWECLCNRKNIVFVNIPFITHFLVGVLYTLLHAFESIYIGKGIIICCDCNRNLQNVFGLFGMIHKEYMRLESNCTDDIIQVIHPKHLDDNVRFLNLLWNYNNQLFHQKASVRVFTFFDLHNHYT